MPSINEVWEQAQQANAHLAVLHNDIVALEACCQEVVAGVDELATQTVETNDWLESIREVLVDGFEAMTRQSHITHELLFHSIRQREAQICQLEQIAGRLCRLLNIAAQQELHLDGVAREVPTIVNLLEHAAPAAALAVGEHRRLRNEVEACCPPPAHDPECRHDSCDAPGEIARPDDQEHPVASPVEFERRRRRWVRDEPR